MVLHRRFGLCRDLRYRTYAETNLLLRNMTDYVSKKSSESKYVALKVYISGVERNHEIKIYNRINSVETTHIGRSFIRQLLGHFHRRSSRPSSYLPRPSTSWAQCGPISAFFPWTSPESRGSEAVFEASPRDSGFPPH